MKGYKCMQRDLSNGGESSDKQVDGNTRQLLTPGKIKSSPNKKNSL